MDEKTAKRISANRHRIPPKPKYENGVIIHNDTLMSIDYSCEKVIIPPNITRTQCGSVSQVKCLEISSIDLLEKFADLPKKLILHEPNLFGTDDTDLFNIGNAAKINKTLKTLGFAGIEWLELDGNEHFTTKDGILYTKDMKSLIRCPRSRTGKIIIPNGVRYINREAFYYCKIEDIVLPDSIEAIGEQAFYSCRLLKHADFGNGLKSIGNEAFSRCYSLNFVDIPESVKLIKHEAFYECDKLKDIGLHNGIERIEDAAFCSCAAEKITLPDSLQYLGKYNFNKTNCVYLSHIPNGFMQAFAEEGWYTNKERQTVLELHMGEDVIYIPQSLSYNGRNEIESMLKKANKDVYWSTFLYANEGNSKLYSALYTYLSGKQNQKLVEFLKIKEKDMSKELLISGHIKELSSFLQTGFVNKETFFELLDMIDNNKTYNIQTENISVVKAYIMQAISNDNKEKTEKFQLP